MVPCGIVNEALALVPSGPTTSIGKVIVVVDAGADGEACRVRVAVPRTDCVEEFLAVTTSVVCAATVDGAV